MRAFPGSMRAPAAGTRAAAAPSTGRKAAGYFFVVPLLIMFWFVFYQNLPGGSFKLTEGAGDRLIKIGTIGLSIAVIATRWSHTRLLLKEINPGMLAFMVLIPLSAAWSIDSAATLLRYVTLLSIVLLCLALALAGWHRQRIQQAALPPVMAILVLSLVTGVIDPQLVKEIGTDISLKDAWRGITYQKNQFGTTASIATIFCAHRLLAPGRHSIWTFVGIATALTCLVLSKSSTSLLGTIVVVFFMVLVLRVPVVKRRFTSLVVIGTFTTILVYALAVQNLIPGVHKLLAPVMHLTGKDMTFSARSIIWDVVKQHAAAAPWLGSGYAAYWPPEPRPGWPSYVFMYIMNFYPTSSHNGYLEIMNDLGRVGLACLVAFLIYFLKQGLQLLPLDRGQAVLYLGLLFQQMVDNLSESEWFSRTATCSILLLASICLSRALVEQRLTTQLTSAGGRRR